MARATPLARLVIVTAVTWPSWHASWGKCPAAAPQERRSEFMRLDRDQRGAIRGLETSVVTYVLGDTNRPALAVDLIAAVHVADADYYARLNELFQSYDVLLYELVAPEAARIPKGGTSGRSTPLGALQRSMTAMLDLEFQLDAIDYSKENFVHADFSPAEFAQHMRDRGESFIQTFFRMVGHAAAVQSHETTKSNDIAMLVALFSSDRAFRLKQILAEQLQQFGNSAMGLDGPEGSTIITERNKRAMDVLDKQIALGKKRVGIFYGAAHMPDMENRLIATFGLRLSRQQWLTAWNLSEPDTKPGESTQQ